MRKQHIIILGIVFGVALLSLILLQISYFNQVLEVRRQQFAFTVYKSMDEVIEYIHDKESNYRPIAQRKFFIQDDGNIDMRSFSGKDFGSYSISEPSFSFKDDYKREITRFGQKLKEDNLKLSISKLQQTIKEQIGSEYNLVFEKREGEPVQLKDIFQFTELQNVLEEKLKNNGIEEPIEFAIKEEDDFVLISKSFNRYVEEYAYTRKIFSDKGDNSPTLYLKFPERSDGVMQTVRIFIPTILIVIALVFCAVFCMVVIVRQKRLSAIKNDFINNMTHEFKTPLATISLASEMLKDVGVTTAPETTKEVATIIYDESKRLTFQVERLLQTALFTENRIKLKLKKVSINDLIIDFLPKLSLRVKDKGGKITSILGATNSEVMADEVHVTNVLSNLVDNAIKYSIHVPKITIRTREKDGYIVISLMDNGIGIAKKDQKLIFERFYRVSTGNLHDVKGFGLGLSYVKKIIEAHGGHVEVESSIDEGSCFDIFLPLIGKNNEVK